MVEAPVAIIAPVLRQVIEYRLAFDRDEHPTIPEVRRQFRELLEAATQEANASADLSGDWEAARRVLVALVDERLASSSWRHARQWALQTMMVELYGEPLADEEFFVLVEEGLDRAGGRAVELVLFCVAMGLGHRWEDPEDLAAWTRGAEARILAELPRPPRLKEFSGQIPRRTLRPLPGGRTLIEVTLLVSMTTLATFLGWLAALSRPLSW